MLNYESTPLNRKLNDFDYVSDYLKTNTSTNGSIRRLY